MSHPRSAGAQFRQVLREEQPLQLVGAINAYTARLAEAVGFRALYLSGGGVAMNSLGVPDLGISNAGRCAHRYSPHHRCHARAAAGRCRYRLGRSFNIARTVRAFIKAGAAGLHIEDQVQSKRCGHRPGKEIVSKDEMVDRVKAAVDARTDEQFVIMARTDALASEGLERAIESACRPASRPGADMIFPEAMTDLSMYRRFKDAVAVPILANITEFGHTPLYTRDELGGAGVDIVLYCCSAYRAMNAAALKTYEDHPQRRQQRDALPLMQTRADLYRYLDYHAYEEKLDDLFAAGKQHLEQPILPRARANERAGRVAGL